MHLSQKNGLLSHSSSCITASSSEANQILLSMPSSSPRSPFVSPLSTPVSSAPSPTEAKTSARQIPMQQIAYSSSRTSPSILSPLHLDYPHLPIGITQPSLPLQRPMNHPSSYLAAKPLLLSLPPSRPSFP